MAYNLNKLTERAQEALVAAQALAEERRNTQVEPEHLLQALVSQRDGVVPAVLGKLGVQAAIVLQQLASASAASRWRAGRPRCECRRKLAREGKLDPVIGRDEEIRRVIQVLSRRTTWQ